MEKEGYRENLAALRERFPNCECITAKQAAEYCGLDIRTVYTHFKFKKIGKKRVFLTLTDFARQISL